MIGHLGHRVSALLDGQLDPGEAERAWEHVHACHSCRDRVEREGWIKTQLASLSLSAAPTPHQLRGSLLAPFGDATGAAYLADPAPRHRTRVALGGGAVGAAAVVSLLALGAAPAAAPVMDRAPTTSLISPTAPGGIMQVGTPPTTPRELGNRAQRARTALSRVTMLW